jgi:GDP-L-fucose synthase
MHEARETDAPEVEIWGTGTPRREFLHVDDLADACVFLLRHYAGEEHINVGTGTDVTIAELARMIQSVVGYRGMLRFNPAYPDGTPRKLMDTSRLATLGWRPRIALADGLRSAYDWFVAHRTEARLAVA